MYSFYHRTAADINLFLYVGVGYIRDVITTAVAAYGEYDENLINTIQDEVLQYDTVLEDQLVEEGWADTAVVQFTGDYDVSGEIEYEDVTTDLDPGEITEIERIVEDFVMPFIEEGISGADVQDLIWIPVESSNVQEFAYDAENRFLYVRFLPSGRGDFANGSIYAYEGVEIEVYQAFLQAPSAGKFVWQYLRDRYDYSRIR